MGTFDIEYDRVAVTILDIMSFRILVIIPGSDLASDQCKRVIWESHVE